MPSSKNNYSTFKVIIVITNNNVSVEYSSEFQDQIHQIWIRNKIFLLNKNLN